MKQKAECYRMLPYLLTITISTICFFLAELSERRRSDDAAGVILAVIGLLLPCALAGARNIGVGMDTTGYGQFIYYAALDSADYQSFQDAVLRVWDATGTSYLVMSFITVKLTHSLFAYFFVIELAAILPFYLAARKLSKGRRLWFVMLGYHLVFFMLSLSAMKQIIAVCFVALSFVEFTDKRVMKAAVLFIVAVGFHTSALIWLVLPILWTLVFSYKMKRWEPRDNSAYIMFLVVFAMVIVVANIRPIFNVVTALPVFTRYRSYFSYSGTTQNIGFFIFFGAMFASLLYLVKTNELENKRVAHFFLIAAFIAFPLYSLQSFQTEFIRLSYYAWAFFPLTCAYCFGQCNALTGRNLLLLRPEIFVYTTLEFTQFFWWYIINDYWHCLPYASSLMGIG